VEIQFDIRAICRIFMHRVAIGHIFLKYFIETLPVLIHHVMYEVCHLP